MNIEELKKDIIEKVQKSDNIYWLRVISRYVNSLLK